ncbi:MAG: hypothetical protein HKO71_04680, partial [Pseudomonadales bacterium]|nr:hypothetical protein [Gammaproteobacteria bacterium]NNL57023.1 hypothetical protein [Pseudomonadales bacterium]
MRKPSNKPVSATLGAAVLAAALAPGANASVNPFSATPLASGYDVVNFGKEGKCGEGKCGDGAKATEGKC